MDDLGRHVRRRVQAGGGDAAALQLLGQVEREQDLRELALAVRAHPVVALVEHHVVEVDRHLPAGGDVHDPRRRRPAQQVEQPPGQRVAGEVVDREPELVAVRALHPLAAAGDVAADAGVVDQDVEPRLAREHVFGQSPHLGERGQIGPVGAHPVAAAQLRHRRGDPLLAAPVDQNGRAGRDRGTRERRARARRWRR